MTRLSDAKHTVADFAAAMERIATTALAQSWDNVGLLAGDRQARVHRILLCIDLTDPVINEAVSKKCTAVMAYHPPIFKSISRLIHPSDGTDALVFRAIREGLAIYSTHTTLDAAVGGTNDALAQLAGAVDLEPLEYVDQPHSSECKIITFVPHAQVDTVAMAMSAAGAGQIGDYSQCSFRTPGTGTFMGGESTNPAVGKKGALESVEEVRLEMVVPTRRLAKVVDALRSTHPYEEPAFDIVPLKPKPVFGIGRVGRLTTPMTLNALADQLKNATGSTCVQSVGDSSQQITRVIVVAGSAGLLPFKLPLSSSDAIITGEIRHHDALAILRKGCCAIALGHWASERPVLPELARRIEAELPGVEAIVSAVDCDPFSCT